MTAAGGQIIDGEPAPTEPPERAAPGETTTPAIALDEAEQFLYREARLADTHALDAWEALWTDDALYHVPIDPHADPRTHMSIIYDNRNRIATRIKQLHTGRRHAQRPPSSLVRSVTNVELLGTDQRGDTVVGSVVQIVESRDRGPRFWAGRVTHTLRRDESTGGELRMSSKTVVLVDSDRALRSLSFLV